MIIRPATPADIPGILAIWNPVIEGHIATFNSTPHTVDTITAKINETAKQDHAFIVAERDRAIIGFAFYGMFRNGIGYRYSFEHSIYISPEAKGAGLGRALLGVIEDHARGQKGHSMIAGVSHENLDGIGFHQKMGYVEVARVPEVGWKFGRWHDIVLMQKIL